MRQRHVVLTALALLLASGAANAAQKLTMNYTTGESATAFIAKDEGFFAKHGLDVDLVAVTQNSNAPAALESGSVQVGMIQIANLLQLTDGGLDFVAWGELGRKALLTPKPFHSLEVVVARFEPGGSTGDEPYTHGDSEELLIVVEGRVHVQLGAEVFEVEAGDSVHYESSTPHRVANAGDEPAEVLFVISPPSY